MSNVVAGVRLPASVVVMFRRHLERFSLARSEQEVHFIHAELFGMLMVLEQLQRLSGTGVAMLLRHIQGLSNERVKALMLLSMGEGVSPDRSGVE